MPEAKSRRTNSLPKKRTFKKTTENIHTIPEEKAVSLNKLLDFISVIARENNPPQQKTAIAEYAEKVAAREILALPVDENGHVIIAKISGYEEEILEKTVASLVLCINSILKNKKNIKDLHSKMLHARTVSPIISLEYPKKAYKARYQLKRKFIK